LFYKFVVCDSGDERCPNMVFILPISVFVFQNAERFIGQVSAKKNRAMTIFTHTRVPFSLSLNQLSKTDKHTRFKNNKTNDAR
jgi:hypothetical protein